MNGRDTIPRHVRLTVSGPLATLQRRAEESGWRCLSEVWDGAHTRYWFECASGHRFERHATVVLYQTPTGCPECKREALRDRWMATLRSRGGELVEGTFTTANRRYRLRCAAGHEWETSGELISRGKWCPRCGREESRRRNTLEDGLARLHAVAAERGGRCFATEYRLSRDHYPFECSQGHRWMASGYQVTHGNWCAQCEGIRRRLTLEEMQALAATRGGLCLSTEYLGNHVKLTWQCHRGHVWQANMSNVKYKGRWCRECAILDQIRAKNSWKRRRYEAVGKLD